jgi:hypothetical protein
LYLRLEPVSWRQEIRDYPSISVEGRYLEASCKAAADSDLRLSNNAKLTDLTVAFSILVGEPVDAGWPAPGSEDTELGVLMELEVGHGETEVYARVQA